MYKNACENILCISFKTISCFCFTYFVLYITHIKLASQLHSLHMHHGVLWKNLVKKCTNYKKYGTNFRLFT